MRQVVQGCIRQGEVWTRLGSYRLDFLAGGPEMTHAGADHVYHRRFTPGGPVEGLLTMDFWQNLQVPLHHHHHQGKNLKSMVENQVIAKWKWQYFEENDVLPKWKSVFCWKQWFSKTNLWFMWNVNCCEALKGHRRFITELNGWIKLCNT